MGDIGDILWTLDDTIPLSDWESATCSTDNIPQPPITESVWYPVRQIGSVEDILSQWPNWVEKIKELDEQVNPPQSPLIALTASPDFGLRAVGDVVPAINLTATATKTTDQITEVRIVRQPDDTLMATDDTHPNGGVMSYSDSEGIDHGSRTYQAIATDIAGRTAMASGTFEFVFPAFTGVVNSATPTPAQLKALTEHVVRRSSISRSYTTASQRICAAFPVSWGLPTAIRDQNSFAVDAAFNRFTETVELGGYNTEYNVFVFNVANTLVNFGVTFFFE